MERNSTRCAGGWEFGKRGWPPGAERINLFTYHERRIFTVRQSPVAGSLRGLFICSAPVE